MLFLHPPVRALIMQQTTPSPDELSLPFGKADFISLNKMEMYVKHTLWIQFVAWGGKHWQSHNLLEWQAAVLS